MLAYLLWAPASLVGLPCAALLLVAPAARERSDGAQALGAVIGSVSVALLVVGGVSEGRLGAAQSAWTVLVTAAFVMFVMVRPEAFLRQALRSIAVAALALGVLIQIIWGSGAWGILAWETTRETSLALRYLVQIAPRQYLPYAFAMHEPMVRLVSLTWPGMVVLQTLAGLALAWQLHLRIASPALGAPLTRFKEFCIGDGWVWGIVAWLAVLILPVSGGGALHVAGTNVGLVAGTLYVLRGAAIVATFAEAFGVSTALLVVLAAATAALAVPLLFVLPGLCTLGITDTWYQYRRRLAAARERQRSNTT